MVWCIEVDTDRAVVVADAFFDGCCCLGNKSWFITRYFDKVVWGSECSELVGLDSYTRIDTELNFILTTPSMKW